MTAFSESIPDHNEVWLDVAPVLDREIGRLSDNLRVAVLLCDVEGKTREEAARQLGCPVATISTRLTKARSLLAARLRRQGVVLSAATLGVLLSQNAASAAVPAALVASTLQTASVVAIGQVASVSLAPSQMIALAKGAVKSMVFVNLKTAAAGLVVLATLGLGLQTESDKQPDEPKAAVVAQAPQQNNRTELPPAIQAALKKNATMFSNVFITGERNRRLLAPAETVLKTLQTTELEADFTQQLHFELRFKGSQFRESIQYPPGDTYTKDALYEVSFDGTKFIMGYKRLKDLASSVIFIHTSMTAAAYAKSRGSPEMLSTMEFWYLVETGFLGPKTIDRLGRPVQSTILSAADHEGLVAVNVVGGRNGKMLEVIFEQPEPWQSRETFDIETHYDFTSLKNGTDKLQMRMERERRQLVGMRRVIRLWLNSELGYAVEEKWVSRKESGETMFHTKNSDFVQIGPGGVWAPKRCVVESHAYATAPLFISSDPLYEDLIQLEKCEPGNFDDDQFRIWYDTPGVMISDFTSPQATLEDAVTYRVGWTPKEAESNREQAIQRATAEANERLPLGLDRVKPKSPVHWFLLANVLVVLAVGVFFGYRRFIKSN